MDKNRGRELGIAKRRIKHRAAKWAATKTSGVTDETLEAALARARDEGVDNATICHNFDYSCATTTRNLRGHLRELRREPIATRYGAHRPGKLRYNVERVLQSLAWLKRSRETRADLVRRFGEWEPLFDAYADAGLCRWTEHNRIARRIAEQQAKPSYSPEIRHSAAYRSACAELDAATLEKHRALLAPSASHPNRTAAHEQAVRRAWAERSSRRAAEATANAYARRLDYIAGERDMARRAAEHWLNCYGKAFHGRKRALHHALRLRRERRIFRDAAEQAIDQRTMLQSFLGKAIAGRRRALALARDFQQRLYAEYRLVDHYIVKKRAA